MGRPKQTLPYRGTTVLGYIVRTLLDADLKVATKSYGLAGPIPLKVVIDHNGIVRYSHVGDYPPGEDELPFVLEDLIGEMGKEK